MRILRIGGRNLASLAGDFEVDFEREPLASSGLFAISGPTGAGKSTLLDALCLALYDATPRLDKGPRAGNYLPDVGDDVVSVGDRRTLLRRGTAEAHAEVDFVGNDGCRYRARWSVRRSRNRPGGALQPSAMSLHALPQLSPLGGTKTEVLGEIAARIGLSFEQFTRSVLLAQNEFSAFLRTDENERGELLETLTGSAVYSDISRRAFERWRAEEEALKRLTSRLQDQAPLAAEERAALDQEHAAAQERLAAVDARRLALEAQLRWHQERERLRAAEEAAASALAQAQARLDATQERRRRLATLDAVQPARLLVADLTRLANEQRQVQTLLAGGEAELARVQAARQSAAQGVIEAERKLDAAEARLREAAGPLDEAKALDATLAALAPAHANARAARERLAREAADARVQLASKDERLAACLRALQEASDWLAAHGAQAGLAGQWARWEQRLLQAEDAARQDTGAAAALAKAQAAAAQAAEATQRTAASLAGAAELMAQREAARQEAAAALRGIDTDGLRAERQAAQARREALGTLEQSWSQWTAAQGRLRELDAQAAGAAQAREAAREALAEAREASIAIEARALQAERALKAAQLACADGVEKLRATLEHGAPCPVCGSEAHPYRHQDERLHALFEELAGQLDACRREQRANVDRQAAQRAAMDAAAERIEMLGRERAQVAEGIAQLQDELDAHPLAHELPQDGARTWFASQQAALRAAFAALDVRDGAAQRLLLARDAAQGAWDAAQREHARLADGAQNAAARLATLEADIAANAARREAAAAQLAGLLAELNPVLSEAAGGAWRAAWERDPGAWRAARAGEARAWNERAAQQAHLSAALATLQAERDAAAARADAAARQAQEAEAEHARLDAQSTAQGSRRAALFGGRAAREVEGELTAHIGAARESVNAAHAAREAAAQAETRVREAHAQAQARIADLGGELQDAGARLQAWLEDFAGNHPELEPIVSETDLGKLLQVGAAWIGQERAGLLDLDSAVRQAGTVLDERRRQGREHGAAMPPATPERIDAVGSQLDAVRPERHALHESAAALAVRIGEDDGRRLRAQAMMGGIERQQAELARWARLSELIGSADGKKFRNYAQQFTLDVLLGYANTHLAQLARRYRLERVASGSGPSLALVVRDQDMGGEVRSVNSLSGGESFLVSLALALGLASLSSNRVKVESLFIDEGFGSLDSDTLGVAMDALDALQSLGRKVGVISHVQEMTERISTKVLVRPAGGGSSAVTVA